MSLVWVPTVLYIKCPTCENVKSPGTKKMKQHFRESRVRIRHLSQWSWCAAGSLCQIVDNLREERATYPWGKNRSTKKQTGRWIVFRSRSRQAEELYSDPDHLQNMHSCFPTTVNDPDYYGSWLFPSRELKYTVLLRNINCCFSTKSGNWCFLTH